MPEPTHTAADRGKYELYWNFTKSVAFLGLKRLLVTDCSSVTPSGSHFLSCLAVVMIELQALPFSVTHQTYPASPGNQTDDLPVTKYFLYLLVWQCVQDTQKTNFSAKI